MDDLKKKPTTSTLKIKNRNLQLIEDVEDLQAKEQYKLYYHKYQRIRRQQMLPLVTYTRNVPNVCAHMWTTSQPTYCPAVGQYV